MEIHELSKELKEARESQGLSLDEVHEQTKINKEFLQALEEGEIERLPHPVYAKGFLQNYARFLGLDWQKMGEDFSRIYLVDEYEQMEELPTTLQEDKISIRPYIYKFFLTAVIIIAVAGAGWFVYITFLGDDAPREVQEEPRIEQEEVVDAPGYEEVFKEFSRLTLDPQETLPEDKVANDEPVLEDPEFFKITEEVLQGPHTPLDAAEDFLPEMITVFIQADEECWLLAEADTTSREYMLRPGDEITLEYRESLLLRLGNAGGVNIEVNGEPYHFEASSGEVKTLEFDRTDDAT